MDVADKPVAVQQGEAFETEIAEQFLKDNISRMDGTLDVAQFPKKFKPLIVAVHNLGRAATRLMEYSDL